MENGPVSSNVIVVGWRVGRRRLGNPWRCEGDGQRRSRGVSTTAEPARARPDVRRVRMIIETVARRTSVIPLGVVLVRENTRAQGDVSS